MYTYKEQTFLSGLHAIALVIHGISSAFSFQKAAELPVLHANVTLAEYTYSGGHLHVVEETVGPTQQPVRWVAWNELITCVAHFVAIVIFCANRECCGIGPRTWESGRPLVFVRHHRRAAASRPPLEFATRVHVRCRVSARHQRRHANIGWVYGRPRADTEHSRRLFGAELAALFGGRVCRGDGKVCASRALRWSRWSFPTVDSLRYTASFTCLLPWHRWRASATARAGALITESGVATRSTPTQSLPSCPSRPKSCCRGRLFPSCRWPPKRLLTSHPR